MQITDEPVDLPAHTQYTRWNGTHLDTIRRCVNRARTEYVWIVADCCNYATFDFTWQPVPWEADQIHCWASGDQKFGDTFLVPVSAFKKQEQGLKLLEWYEHINWHNQPEIARKPWPTVKNVSEISTLYAWIKNTPTSIAYDPSLWKERNLHAFGTNGSVLLVPRDCKTHFKTQFYDYPYILCHTDWKVDEKPQDIVFISYDEKNADINYGTLRTQVSEQQPAKDPVVVRHVHRVHGVEGMVNALKEAAKRSTTDHFFAVFAKTEVHPDFEFDHQPDRLAEPKHYIFDAYNPVLDYTYGHDGIVMYNKQLVLSCTEWGMDFTMSFPVQHVPEVSCINKYNYSPYSTWRTAFREALKLTLMPQTIETRYRLELWKTQNNAENGDWSIKGANDGVDYINKSDNLLSEIYDWSFLKNHFEDLYGQQ